MNEIEYVSNMTEVFIVFMVDNDMSSVAIFRCEQTGWNYKTHNFAIE